MRFLGTFERAASCFVDSMFPMHPVLFSLPSLSLCLAALSLIVYSKFTWATMERETAKYGSNAAWTGPKVMGISHFLPPSSLESVFTEIPHKTPVISIHLFYFPPPLWRQSNCDRGSSSLNIIRPWKYPFNAPHWIIHWPYLCADCPWMPDIAIRMLCFSCVPCCKFAPAARQTVMIPAGLGVLPGPSSPLGIFFFFSGKK